MHLTLNSLCAYVFGWISERDQAKYRQLQCVCTYLSVFMFVFMHGQCVCAVCVKHILNALIKPTLIRRDFASFSDGLSIR